MKTEIAKQALHSQESARDQAPRELDVAEIAQVGGAYACSYSGTHDYTLMMSYENRNYSC